MNRTTSPTSSRWAIILLSAAVLALAGCGRKGGLDLPPHAQAQSDAQGDVDAERPAGQPGAFNPSSGIDAAGPTAPKGRKKAFVLDPLLD